MEKIIEIKNISKKYSISHQQDGYLALRDKIAHPIKAIKESRKGKEDFWALRDINFDIEKGDIIGIIGKNGSGKSTLLKILSRITPPTEGEIRIKGRVASLLEVGTGFHPELSGRENVYLSGVILGMSKGEISEKFDQIVEFAGVDKFLDTPVKRYSSGMMVRLGFSVAAHLEPDVLIVDEVLAVGDAEFQKKSLGKMGEVVDNNKRTIIFVSHDMMAIKKLCNKCVFLDKGEIIFQGDTENVINYYLQKNSVTGSAISASVVRDGFKNVYYFTKVELKNSNSELSSHFEAGETMEIHLYTNQDAPLDRFGVEMRLLNSRGNLISFGASSPMRNKFYKKEDRHFVCRLGPLPLTAGRYFFDFAIRIWGAEKWDSWENAISFVVSKCEIFDMQMNIESANERDFIINQEWC